ncbi:HigA family addiction module antitoxin [Myxococcota bacterium]|nr:HigA family addiction module antitoxin [Myxococcota bacterium]
MLPERRVSTHPGEVLIEDFLNPMSVTQTAFAAHIGVPIQRINEIVRGKRGVTADTAWLFAQALGTSPELWMGLQADYDLTIRRMPRKVPRLRPAA